MNFVHSNPLICTSVGLAINRKLVAGIVYNPVMDHLYTAVKGKGAFLNGSKRLKVSGVKELKKAMVLVEILCGARKESREAMMVNMDMLMDKAHAVRCLGKYGKN